MKKTILVTLSVSVGTVLFMAALFGLHGHSRADGSAWTGSEIVASGETVEVGQ